MDNKFERKNIDLTSLSIARILIHYSPNSIDKIIKQALAIVKIFSRIDNTDSNTPQDM